MTATAPLSPRWGFRWWTVSDDEYEGTEADWMEENAEYDFHRFRDDGTGTCTRCGMLEGGCEHVDFDTSDWKPERRAGSHYRGGDKLQAERWRCLKTGCNPVLNGVTAAQHKAEMGHRVAAWPVRSAEGKKRARERNCTGYYDQYNVGYKSAEWRLS